MLNGTVSRYITKNRMPPLPLTSVHRSMDAIAYSLVVISQMEAYTQMDMKTSGTFRRCWRRSATQSSMVSSLRMLSNGGGATLLL